MFKQSLEFNRYYLFYLKNTVNDVKIIICGKTCKSKYYIP